MQIGKIKKCPPDRFTLLEAKQTIQQNEAYTHMDKHKHAHKHKQTYIKKTKLQSSPLDFELVNGLIHHLDKCIHIWVTLTMDSI